MADKDKALCEIYVYRNDEVIELTKQGMRWEEIQEKVAHYQDEIDELVYSPRELEKKNSTEPEPEVGKQTGIYKLEGLLSSKLTRVNGRNLYKRVLIRRVGIRTYVGGGRMDFGDRTRGNGRIPQPAQGIRGIYRIWLPTETE